MSEITPDTGKTVLLVDDAPENLYSIGTLLQPHYRVRVANSGTSALAVARGAPCPDLILLDIMMPEMDGYEVMRQLRAEPRTREIPVIFVTAMNSDADEERGLSLGAVDYIFKPVTPALLLARVRTQLELKEARDWLKHRNTLLADEVARQVVELKAAKEVAEAASRSKSDFIGTMSHELRTPMNGVIGMLQLAVDEVPGTSTAHEYLTIALESAQSMVAMLAAILEYADIAHGEVHLHAHPVNLQTLLDTLALQWRARAEQKGLKYGVRLPPVPHEEIVCDEVRLTQVLAALLDNAIKFTASGQIEAGVESTATGTHFWVSDTGIGIPDEQQSAIFEAFIQGDGSTTRQYGGAGLGLAIAKRLVDLMAGKLWVDSQPGKGSTFHVELPASAIGAAIV